jgi:hypothetical protein
MPPSNRAVRIVAIPVLALLVSSRCAADEAVRPDGRRTAGTLRTNPEGRLQFTPKDAGADLPLADVEHVRFPEAASHSTFLGAALRIEMLHRQCVTGELLDLDEKSVNVRTFWSNRIRLARRGVVALTQLTGLVTVFHEDFEIEPVHLKLTGSPLLNTEHRTSGRRSLQLDALGQFASHALTKPLDAGRFGVNFRDLGEPSGARWLAEADFGGKEPLRVVLAGGEAYAVETDLAGETQRLARAPGWHRLDVRFRPDYLLVGVDGRLLFESAKQGPEPLREVRLACVAGAPDKSIRGAVLFDDLAVAKSVDELRHEPSDPGQDELWLLGGDQLFGSVPRVDRRAAEIHGRFGKRSLPWSALRGLFFKSEEAEPQSSDGQHVRVWLDNGFPEPDELEGVLRALDDSKLTLRHALLGDLTFDRSRLRRLRPLFFGRRIELDNGRHHLGDAGRLVPFIVPPRSEGPTLRRTFRLDAVPPSARVTVTVHHLKGAADGIGPALERGDLRTEVFVNEKRIDYLNRHVDRAVAETRRLAITIPNSVLRISENVVELRQTPEAASGRRESCVVANLAVELPR